MTGMHLNIMSQVYRKFKSEDAEVVVELMRQLGYKHSVESVLKNTKMVRRAGGEVFVCENSSKVCGCASAILDTRLAEGITGEIVSVVVNASYRGQGIGKGLVTTAETWLKNYVSIVRIRANVVRKEAHTFYQSMGYSMSKTQAVFNKHV